MRLPTRICALVLVTTLPACAASDAVESAAPPRDEGCVPTACADPAEEVVVRIDVRMNGKPLDARDQVDLAAGQTAEFALDVEVEPGYSIEDLHVGIGGDGVGAGPSGPLGFTEVLVKDESVTGSESFKATWSVPMLSKPVPVAVYYVSDKYQPDARHARTVGTVANRK